MFTGIIESVGIIKSIKKDGSNMLMEVKSSISKHLKIDQSVSHNGVCLTIIRRNTSSHFVVLVQETLARSNFGELKPGSKINLERAMNLKSRLDGHMVLGHVDKTSRLLKMETNQGSWTLKFELSKEDRPLIVEKGSICLNGISLTISACRKKFFTVDIIPYTWKHTNIHQIAEGDSVNIEFDILGKYIYQNMSNYLKNISDKAKK